MKIKNLSIFLPAFNEENNLTKVIDNVLSGASQYAENWEIIIVDDGSTDGTRQIAESLAEKDKRIKVISHNINKGYGSSLKTGFYNAKYSWIAFIDSDGQFDFMEIGKFIEKQEETKADLVIGYYKKRKAAPVKIATSKIWELFIHILFGLKVHDIDCGFKLISKKYPC